MSESAKYVKFDRLARVVDPLGMCYDLQGVKCFSMTDWTTTVPKRILYGKKLIIVDGFAYLSSLLIQWS